jgi:hypothetical protein
MIFPLKSLMICGFIVYLRNTLIKFIPMLLQFHNHTAQFLNRFPSILYHTFWEIIFFTKKMMPYTPPGREFFTVADDAAPVKLLSVNGVAPTEENIRSGLYPFTVDIFAVTAGTGNPNVRKLIDWLLSPQGQELIEKVGYVGI